MLDENRRKTLINLLCAALWAAGVWAFFRYVFGWIAPFLIAFAAAWALEPAVRFLTTKWRLPRWIASAGCVLLAIALFAALVVLVVGRVVYEGGALLRRAPGLMAALPDVTGGLASFADKLIAAAPVQLQDMLHLWANEFVESGASLPGMFFDFLGSIVIGALSAVPGALLYLTAAALLTYFISRDYASVCAFFARQIPVQRRERAREARDRILGVLGCWLRAQGILLLGTFIVLAAGFLLLRIPYWLILAAAVALFDALPLVGTGTVMIPWAIVEALGGNLPKGAALLAVFLAASTLRSLLEPRLTSSRLGVSPVVTLAAMYAGFVTAGAAGLILFPLGAVIVKQLHDWGYIRVWK